MISVQTEKIKIPTDPADWRAYIATLDEAARLALFGVARQSDGDYSAVDFICTANGRPYASMSVPIEHNDPTGSYVSTTCYWCDAYGRQRGSPGFDRDAPQAHAYPLVEAAHATID